MVAGYGTGRVARHTSANGSDSYLTLFPGSPSPSNKSQNGTERGSAGGSDCRLYSLNKTHLHAQMLTGLSSARSSGLVPSPRAPGGRLACSMCGQLSHTHYAIT